MNGPRWLQKVMLVAWREFRYTALTPAFLMGVIGVPVVLIALAVLYPLLFSGDSKPFEGTLAIVETSGDVAARAESIINSGGLVDEITENMDELFDEMSMPGSIDVASAARATMHIDLDVSAVQDVNELNDLKAQLLAGDLLAIAVVPEVLLDLPTTDEDSDQPTLEIFVRADSSPQHTTSIKHLLQDAIVEVRTEHAGLDYDHIEQLLASPRATLTRVSDEGEKTENVKIRMILPIVLMMLLWMSTFTSGNYILTTTIEEKSNRVMEVLLSAVSPMELMSGKILGQAGVALLMLITYGGMALAGLAMLAAADLVSVGLLLLTGAYFVIAYFTIASIMAAIGSAVSDLRDAQSLMGPAVLVLILPLILWLPITNNPDSPLALVVSFIPPLIPFVMILRVAAASEPLPFWQIATSLVLGIGSVWVMLFVCGRIFRVGVLMQGKPPSPMELIRWMRYR